MHTTILVNERNQAEQAAQESEQRYKRLLASVTDYVYSVTVERGRPVATSHGPGCVAVTGYTSREFEADPFLWYRMICSEDRPAVTAQTERILRGETPPPLEHRIVHKNGRIRWIRNTTVPHNDDQGRLISYDGLISDITDRKRAEEDLARLNQQYELILRSAAEGILGLDVQGKHTFVNPAAARMLDYEPEELLGRASHSTWHHTKPDGSPYPKEECGIYAAYRDGAVHRASTEVFWRKDGTSFPVEYASTPIHERGRLEGAVVTFTDITERKRAELALRQSEERLALVIQGSSDGVWDWDLTTDEVYFSSRWKSMLGHADHELPNHFSTWEGLLHPADRERARACLQAYLSGQTRAYELEHRLRHKDGSYRWILARGVALRDAQGKPVRMAGSHVDLTDRKQVEEQLQRAYAELSQNEAALQTALQKLKTANEELQTTQLELIQAAKLESVGTLAAGVAHEVKNPLQTILMGLDYLANPLPSGSGDTTPVLSDMRDAVTRANVIVRELLQLSADTDFDPKEEDLNGAVERSLWLINSDVIASQISVVRKLAADLPRVLMDRSKMEQVFINLFINALQAMVQGGVLSVTTRHRRFGEDLKLGGLAFPHFRPGDQLVIAEVRDTGKGIHEDLLPKVFDPFFTTKPVGVGTGLGLSVVKKIIDLHGGAIDIRNGPLGGVVVTLMLRAEPDKTP